MTTQTISEKIIELLRQDPAMSRKKLAEALGDITEDGVNYHGNQTEKRKSKLVRLLAYKNLSFPDKKEGQSASIEHWGKGGY